jgi:eukaryotic-like serine/threonine-protein kinase
MAQPAVDRDDFEAHDGALVGIKLMSPLLATTSAPRKRFLREARAAAAVRHQNVIAIYAVEEQPIPHLVIDYNAGRTLQQKLDATGPLELLDVLRIGRQIAAGLAAAHAMGQIRHGRGQIVKWFVHEVRIGKRFR